MSEAYRGIPLNEESGSRKKDITLCWETKTQRRRRSWNNIDIYIHKAKIQLRKTHLLLS